MAKIVTATASTVVTVLRRSYKFTQTQAWTLVHKHIVIVSRGERLLSNADVVAREVMEAERQSVQDERQA